MSAPHGAAGRRPVSPDRLRRHRLGRRRLCQDPRRREPGAALFGDGLRGTAPDPPHQGRARGAARPRRLRLGERRCRSRSLGLQRGNCRRDAAPAPAYTPSKGGNRAALDTDHRRCYWTQPEHPHDVMQQKIRRVLSRRWCEFRSLPSFNSVAVGARHAGRPCLGHRSGTFRRFRLSVSTSSRSPAWRRSSRRTLMIHAFALRRNSRRRHRLSQDRDAVRGPVCHLHRLRAAFHAWDRGSGSWFAWAASPP